MTAQLPDVIVPLNTEFIWIEEWLIKNKLVPFILAFHHIPSMGQGLNNETGSSSRVIILPLQDQDFHLHKQFCNSSKMPFISIMDGSWLLHLVIVSVGHLLLQTML